MSCIEQLSEESKFKLLSSLYTKNYFLWIGSGFSYNFGFDSWENVLLKISTEIKYPLELDVSNPLKAAELLCCYAIQHHKYTENDFNSLVSSSLIELKKDGVNPNWVRRFRAFSPNTIVTTNWDDQLESIFDHLPNIVVRKDTSPQVSNRGRNIFKIHGDVGRPDSIVVTQSQYFSFQREDTYLNRKIYTLFSEASPIFLGYSLTDPNISFLYDEVYAHLGEYKPPAYMIVHPSVSDTVLSESKLLFQDKNIHLIKAEIGEFLEDLSSTFTEYKKSTRRFFEEHKNIKDRLKEIINIIIEKNNVTKDKIFSCFVNIESQGQAASAFIEILSNHLLYKEFGGELLAPENRASYREIDQIISTIILLTNNCKFPSDTLRENFYESVMLLCAKSDGVWDFYTAREPFLNILRISPDVKSKIFNDRISHIIDILRWSGPNQRGKCWDTWREFCNRIDWLNTVDIDAIIEKIQGEDTHQYNIRDNQWLNKLTECKNCNENQKEKIIELIER